jgi:hypothetical protein
MPLAANSVPLTSVRPPGLLRCTPPRPPARLSYFGWLDFYTQQLKYPAFLGAFVMFTRYLGKDQYYPLMGFCSFVSVWATMQTQLWNRRNATLNLWWGMTGLTKAEPERPQFYGTVRYAKARKRSGSVCAYVV